MTTASTTASTTEAIDTWGDWRQERTASATAPDGPAALTGTHWVTATSEENAVEVPGVPGRWHADGEAVVGTGLPADWTGEGEEGTVRLALGERLSHGVVTLVGHVRAGTVALRTFDATSANHADVEGIEAFDHDERWVVPATFTADPATVEVTSADGFIADGEVAGWLTFTVPDADGTPSEQRLQVKDTGDGFFVSFADLGRESGSDPAERTFGFRFLKVPAPDADGNTIIDFNRVELPAFAFSGAYLCPLPSQENTLDVVIPAGEKPVLRAGAAA